MSDNNHDQHSSGLDREVKPEHASSPEPETKPTVTKGKRKNATTSAENPASKKKTDGNTSRDGPGAFSPAKQAELLDHLIGLGFKHANKDELCTQFGLNKLQIDNALRRDRASNFRCRAVAFIAGNGKTNNK